MHYNCIVNKSWLFFLIKTLRLGNNLKPQIMKKLLTSLCLLTLAFCISCNSINESPAQKTEKDLKENLRGKYKVLFNFKSDSLNQDAVTMANGLFAMASISMTFNDNGTGDYNAQMGSFGNVSKMDWSVKGDSLFVKVNTPEGKMNKYKIEKYDNSYNTISILNDQNVNVTLTKE